MLQRVLGFLIVILVLPDIYIYRTFIKQLTLSLFWRILYFFPTLFLMAGVVSLAFFANYEYAEQHTLWIGRFAVVFFLFASPKLIFTICSIIGRPFNRWLHWSRKPFVATGLFRSKGGHFPVSPSTRSLQRIPHCSVVRYPHRELAGKRQEPATDGGPGECTKTGLNRIHG